MKSEFLKQIMERGYFYQATHLEQMDQIMCEKVVPAYIGFDPTAKSLHIGNLVQLMILRKLQQTGHKPIIVVGGGTSKIGDPSGKDEARKLITDEIIEDNIKGILASFKKFISFDQTPTGAILVNNAEWLATINYIDFLREYGKLFSVNRMLSMDSVKSRLDREQNLTFLEFNYMLLQAYDFVYLKKNYGCMVQIGGSDQWGNIISGIELGHKLGLNNMFGLTSNLILTSAGQKMGKSVNGAIWLNDDMCSPYDYWQYWRNVSDADVPRFLKLYTDFTLEEIEIIISSNNINDAKKILASAATELCHGKEAAKLAEETAKNLFENNIVSDNLPKFTLNKAKLGKLIDIMVDFGITKTKSEARQLIRGGGVLINQNKVTDELYEIQEDEFENNIITLFLGKKRCILLELEEK